MTLLSRVVFFADDLISYRGVRRITFNLIYKFAIL